MNNRDFLIAWVQEARKAGRSAYLLVDSAQHENSHLDLASASIHFLSLFEETKEKDFIEIAPLLIPLNGLSASSLEYICSRAAELAEHKPCITWMSSDLTADELARYLARFHLVGVSDNQKMLLRWYDTRILPVWVSCLTPEQRSIFAAKFFELSFFDERAMPQRIFKSEVTLPTGDASDFGQPIIVLSDAQLSVLIDAAGLPALIQHLRDVIRDETNLLTPRELRDFVFEHWRAAVAAGLDDIDRQTQYLLVALYTSGAGVYHEEFKRLMKPKPPAFDEFCRAIQDLSPAVWDSGPPLWASKQVLTAVQ